jgi:hypothetical protein
MELALSHLSERFYAGMKIQTFPCLSKRTSLCSEVFLRIKTTFFPCSYLRNSRIDVQIMLRFGGILDEMTARLFEVFHLFFSTYLGSPIVQTAGQLSLVDMPNCAI